MAAQTIETLHLLNRTLIRVHSDKKSKLPEFVYPRPGQHAPSAQVVTHRQMSALMGAR